MTPKNCLILAPPLSGARLLAKQLVEAGYDPGKSLPSLLDPGLSSFEDGHVVYLNSSLFVLQKSRNHWNGPAKFNTLSFFLDAGGRNIQWPRHVAAPALIGLGKKPWVRKDPQFIFTWKHWQENVWHSMPVEDLPAVVMILRYPLDWINAIFARIDNGVWPNVAKDMDYFRGLWIDYVEHMFAIAHQPEMHDRIFATTLDHLCISEIQARLARSLGLPKEEMPCFDITKIEHSSGHQLEKLDETAGVVWDKWQWTALQNTV